jgi:hypothetical protein
LVKLGKLGGAFTTPERAISVRLQIITIRLNSAFPVSLSGNNVTVQPAPVIIKSDPAIRGLTTAQKVRFQSAISQVEPGHIEDFCYLGGDMDGKIVRDDVFHILKQHQWKLPEEPGSLGGEDFYGVRMYLSYADVIPRYYAGLRRAFETVWPVDAHEYKRPDYKSGDAHIRIDTGHRYP